MDTRWCVRPPERGLQHCDGPVVVSQTETLPHTTLQPGERYERIFTTFRDGRPVLPWRFSNTSSPQPGRFDLPAPSGTAYFSDDLAGCWLEVFRSTVVVAQDDVDRRSVATIERSGTTLTLANLTSPAAVQAGVTLDLSAGADYVRTQRLASEVLSHAFGIISWIRHDPAARFRNVALFGTAGARQRVAGWRTTTQQLNAQAEAIAVRLGVRVIPIPHDLPTTDQTSRR